MQMFVLTMPGRPFAKNLKDPGNLLGYRAMTQKIRQKYKMKVPRDLVHNLMFYIDPDGLAARLPGAKKKKTKGHFITLGPNWTYSLDGHDMLMGFQNSTFPFYGCVDTASRKLMWLKIWTSNSNRNFIGKWYIEALRTHYLRLDKGTETTTMSTTMHIFDTSK